MSEEYCQYCKGEERRCFAVTDDSEWLCTRPEGHGGPHVACGSEGTHCIATWKDGEDWEYGDILEPFPNKVDLTAVVNTALDRHMDIEIIRTAPGRHLVRISFDGGLIEEHEANEEPAVILERLLTAAARRSGTWSDPGLVAFGRLSSNMEADVKAILEGK